MIKVFKIILLTAIVFFALVIVLMINGKLTFGGCLADLIPLYFQIAWVIILLLMIVFLTNKKTTFKLIFSGLFSVVVILSIFFSIKGFTIDRGRCYPWNGRIFMISSEEYQRIKDEKYKNKLDSLNKIILSNPKDYKTITEKGIMLSENEEWNLSIVEFKKALQIDSNYFVALYHLGFSYCDLGDWRSGLPLLEKARLIDSTNKDVNTRIENIKYNNKIK